MQPPGGGVCVVCGRELARGGRYWLTAHPDGVHHACRAWELEPFPFQRDLVALRRIARVVREAWRATLREGRWLAASRQRWAGLAGAKGVARQLADDWLDRKAKLERRLNELRDRMRF
jgi:hypothetical protein